MVTKHSSLPHIPFNIIEYLKDRFNYEYLISRFGYPSHFAGMNNCGIAKNQPHPLIGRAVASPPSRSAGADFYIYIYICHPAMMVPGGPRATRKRKAGSITSGYLANVVGASPCAGWTGPLYVLQASLG